MAAVPATLQPEGMFQIRRETHIIITVIIPFQNVLPAAIHTMTATVRNADTLTLIRDGLGKTTRLAGKKLMAICHMVEYKSFVFKINPVFGIFA